MEIVAAAISIQPDLSQTLMLTDRSPKMQNPGSLDWNDLRYFLAVARSGSTLAASRLLRVSQSTVSRRIDVAEATLGLTLFDRQRTGYVLTKIGAALLPAAKAAEQACLGFEREALARARGLSGTVRLAANELIANAFLDHALAQFRIDFPTLRIETITGEEIRDLSTGDVDISIRGGPSPTDAGLVGRILTKDPWSMYASRAYVDRNGAPISMAETADHSFIAFLPGRVEQYWVDQLDMFLKDRVIVVRRDSMTGMLAAIRSGVGVGVMSDIVAGSVPDLIRLFGLEQQRTPEIWLLTHERLRTEPRIRVVMDFLAGYFSRKFHQTLRR